MNQLRNCTRVHGEGTLPLIAICTNLQCPIKLMCAYCYSQYHATHIQDVIKFTDLATICQTQVKELKESNINQMIQGITKQFNQAKQTLQLTLNKLETLFHNNFNSLSELIRVLSELADNETNELTEDLAQRLVRLKFHEGDIPLKLAADINLKQPTIKLLNQASNILITDSMDFVIQHITDQILINLYEGQQLDYQTTPKDLLKITGVKQLVELPNDIVYLGEMAQNKRNGKGILIDKQKQQLREGIWEQDIQKWGLSSQLVGDNIQVIRLGRMENMKVQGYGTIATSIGGMYQGEIKNDLKEGKGVFKYLNGDIFEGTYKNDLRDGKGTFKYSNGALFEGKYIKDLAEGQGTYTHQDGLKETGNSIKGMCQGDHFVYKPNTTRPESIITYHNNQIVDHRQF